MWPRARTYLNNLDRSILDEQGRLQICDIEVYQAGNNPAYTASEGKRGDVKYLKYPMYNPSGLDMTVFGPANDGNTYVMIRTTYPGRTQNATLAAISIDARSSNINLLSGFAYAEMSTTIGDIVAGTSTPGWLHRYFLLPINI
jgi:hypothetical protein